MSKTEDLKFEDIDIRSEGSIGDNNDALSDNGRSDLHMNREASSSSASSKSASPIPNGHGHVQEASSSSTPPPSSMNNPSLVKSKSDISAPSTSTGNNGVGASASSAKPGPQLIGHLPRAESQALSTFVRLDDNRYQYSTLGRSREALESMTCDCNFVPGEDEPWVACGAESDCINRLTQVECLEDDCRCRSHCQNQRMQRKEYANVEVVLTEKKGFGLRAGSAIRKDDFIYEYIGEVVSQPSFAKRMRDYAEEGIRHFYFMMLQKDEFIDATKKGGVGRFANHSCNPNCYVAKWTVGTQVRMGIYAKRNIVKDEELTFNYNVDRYGHEAQACYCGEPNCIGYIGGKTQTDVAAMDDLYLDALGISDEVELYGLKGSKKKKSKKLDEDYNPILKPLLENDIPKVIQAIRQTQSRKVLVKLLTRIKITEDQAALRQIMRLRGFSLMCNILDDFLTDNEISLIVLQCISTWPLLQRNKIEDSKIEEPVKELQSSEDQSIKELAEKLLTHWATLEVGYRIPKRLKGEADDIQESRQYFFEEEDQFHISKRNRLADLDLPEHLPIAQPLGRRPYSPPRNTFRVIAVRVPSPKPKPKPPVNESLLRFDFSRAKSQDVDDVIAAAAKAMEEEMERKKALEAKEKEDELLKEKKAAEKIKRKTMSKEEKEALKEKKLLKLVGAVVVKCLSKYRDHLDHDTFKKHAKELTQIIADKEKRSQSYIDGKLESLSEEKTQKIKKFAKEYIEKLLRRLEKSGKERTHSHSNGRGDERNKERRQARDPRHVDGASTSTPRSDTASGSNTLVGMHDADEREPHYDVDDDDMLVDAQNGLNNGSDIDTYDDTDRVKHTHHPGSSPMRGITPTLSYLSYKSSRSSSQFPEEHHSTVRNGKAKRNRWDERPKSVTLTPSLSTSDSLLEDR